VDLGHSLPFKNGALTRCNAGYLGAQFNVDGYQTLLWSMAGREEGQIVPVGKYCHYDCFDCSPPNMRDFQCKRDDYKLSLGVSYTFTLQMEMQNASGAMWSVTMVDPMAADAGHPVEVGRVFFKDREFGLPEGTCRVLGNEPYLFQEYWNPNQQEFTTRASWSHVSFSGVMRPQDAEGYCQGGAQVSLADVEGLSREACKGMCVADQRCLFASYAQQDGSHCMLFDRCEARDAFRADIWWTYEKVDAPIQTATAFATKCQHFKDQDCSDRIAVAAMGHLPSGSVEFEFESGKNVRCRRGVAPEEIESERCSARSMARPAGLTAAALRGSVFDAAAHAASPDAALAQGKGMVMFP